MTDGRAISLVILQCISVDFGSLVFGLGLYYGTWYFVLSVGVRVR